MSKKKAGALAVAVARCKTRRWNPHRISSQRQPHDRSKQMEKDAMNNPSVRETRRDFLGYGAEPPDPQWPNDARVAVSFVVNFEEGAELSLADGDERNESEYEEIIELVGAPDFCMESHFEFGTRIGYWRVANLLERFGVQATINACARAAERSPWLVRDAVGRGHEIACHGYRWDSQPHVSEDEERALIDTCVRVLAEASGERPIGWHSKSWPSVNTRRLLVEEGGFLYDSNVYNDEIPYLVQVGETPHVVIPYSFDTNDMRFFQAFGFVHADDFARYCIDAFDWLWHESEHTPRMMTIGLHLRIIGRPGRIAGLETFLEHVTGKKGVWFARRGDIARHWRALNGLPAT